MMGTPTKFSIIFLISAAVASTVDISQLNTLQSSILVSEPFEIVAKQGKSLYSNLGNVAVRNCGGTGRLVQWRMEACTTYTVEGVCVFPAGQNYRGEISFVPSEPTDGFSSRTTVNDNQGEQISWTTRNISAGIPIQAQREYALQDGIVVGPKLQGRMLTVQVQLYRESDKIIEACTKGEFFIV